MSDKTGIEWTDATWNPVRGCTKVSPGCKNCYAERLHNQRQLAYSQGKKVPRLYAEPFEKVQLLPERLPAPLHWRKPRRIFVNSMSDLFHEDVPDDFIDRVFAVMALCPQHTFQILTKRAQRMRAYMDRLARSPGCADQVSDAARQMGHAVSFAWPFPNVWLGVSVEDQPRADERVPELLATPAAVRFISAEPLLGPVNLSAALFTQPPEGEPDESAEAGGLWNGPRALGEKGVSWVIVGGESGPGARPMHPEWARGLRDQCAAAGVPFFFKQWGGKNKKAAGRILDGRTWDQMPEGAK